MTGVHLQQHTAIIPQPANFTHEVTLMTPDEGEGRLQAFIEQWPVGAQLTTRGIQFGAGIPDLLLAEQMAEQLRAQGLLVMETVGATRLWRRCDPAEAPQPLAAPSTTVQVLDTTATASTPTTLSAG